jgi:hypothetical protein
VNRELATIEDAKTLAQAGRGQLLLVGQILSTAKVPTGNVVTIIEYPELSRMNSTHAALEGAAERRSIQVVRSQPSETITTTQSVGK